MAVGRASSYLPDYTKALMAASNIKKLLERKSAIDHTSNDGDIPVGIFVGYILRIWRVLLTHMFDTNYKYVLVVRALYVCVYVCMLYMR